MATDAEIDKAENALKWITTLEGPISVFEKRAGKAAKQLKKNKDEEYEGIRTGLNKLAALAEIIADKSKKGKKTAKELLKLYQKLKKDKIEYSKFKTDLPKAAAIYEVLDTVGKKYNKTYTKMQDTDNGFKSGFDKLDVLGIGNQMSLYAGYYAKFEAAVGAL